MSVLRGSILLVVLVASAVRAAPPCAIGAPGCCVGDADCNDGDACNGVETCDLGTGTCLGGTAITCAAIDGCHTMGECNPLTGECTNPTRPDDFPCDDGNACTLTDTCQAGVCTGADPTICPALDQCHLGTCDRATGQCSSPAKPDGDPCDDQDACTQTDTCQNGACTGGNPVVCPGDQCHDPGTCDPQTGTCSDATPKLDGTPCNDGDACTQTDTCQAGTCTGTNPKTCTALDQCHMAGTCAPATGICSNPPKADTTPCNDGNACTQTDTCQNGTCTGGAPTTCTALDQCHMAGTCDPGTGDCTHPARPNGAGCNDGNACTQTDTCQGGVCTGADAKTCTALDQCHTAGTCNPGTGQCSNPARPDGDPCDDHDACTRRDGCQAGSCVGGDPQPCVAIDTCHTDGTCDPATGACSTPVRDDGTPCDDGDACTRVDACRGGVCVGTDRISCDDSVACTDDACVAGTCVFVPHAERCADTTCTVGACRPGAAGADARGCVLVPVQEGEACTDDGVACTDDVCRAGTCAHDRIDTRCSASDVCGTAVCFPGFPGADAAGCTAGPPAPDGGECVEDQDPCTDDRCSRGTCAHTNVVDRPTCEPVGGPYRRALALAGSTASLGGVIAATMAGGSGGATDTRHLLDERLQGMTNDLEVVIRILSGRAPATDGVGSVAQRRARAATPVADALVPRAQGMVGILKVARRGGELSTAAFRQLGGQAKALLAGTKALKRDLKRIQRISRVFAR